MTFFLSFEALFFGIFVFIQIAQLERGQKAKWKKRGDGLGKDHVSGFEIGSSQSAIVLYVRQLPPTCTISTVFLHTMKANGI